MLNIDCFLFLILNKASKKEFAKNSLNAVLIQINDFVAKQIFLKKLGLNKKIFGWEKGHKQKICTLNGFKY